MRGPLPGVLSICSSENRKPPFSMASAIAAVDALGIFRRPEVVAGPADDPFARHADIVDGRLVGEHVGPVRARP